MGRKMKKLTRAGAGALAGVMVFGLAAPLAPLSVEAADEVKRKIWRLVQQQQSTIKKQTIGARIKLLTVLLTELQQKEISPVGQRT